MEAALRRPHHAGWVAGLVLLLSLAVAGGCGDQGPGHNANLILITIDTLRADFLGCYGYPEPVSPNLDRLAAQAIVFERAYATAPFTGPSHASILTSRHPSEHGMIYNGHRARNLALGADCTTLAEHLQKAGFNTRALVSGGPLDARFGFGRGFEGFTLVPQMDYADSGGDPAEVNRRAGNWLLDWKHTGSRDRFFLWVHYFVPHLPYLCPATARDSLGIPDSVPVVDEGNAGLLPTEVVRQAYRGEVFTVDAFVGALVARLGELELDDDTIIAVVSDHGEYLQEHGQINHHGLYDEVLHVPMFITWRALKAAERRPATASTLDLVPTLLEMLEVPALPGARGRSRRHPAPATPVFAEWRDFHLLDADSTLPGQFQVSIQSGAGKLIRDVLFPEASECYDLATDPAEAKNLYGTEIPLPGELARDLDRHIAQDLPAGLAGVQDIHLDEESLRMLRSLGYVR